jgi:hypothetical protein
MSRARDTADQINRVNSSAADATAITVDSSENVGIGTASPTVFSGYTNVAANNSSGSMFELMVGGTRTANIQTSSSLMNIQTRTNIPIAFDINSSEKMRLDSDGLKFNGDTAAANALNDYEEGTYTPIFDPTSGSATASSIYGAYIKIGDMVQVQLRFSGIIITGNPSGYLKVSLPFNCATGVSSVAVSAYNMNAAMHAPNTEVIHNNNRMYLFGFDNGARIDHTANLLNTGGQLIFGGTYRTS